MVRCVYREICPTKYAPDQWESARFMGFFLASGFICLQTFYNSAHWQVIQTMWAAVVSVISAAANATVGRQPSRRRARLRHAHRFFSRATALLCTCLRRAVGRGDELCARRKNTERCVELKNQTNWSGFLLAAQSVTVSTRARGA